MIPDDIAELPEHWQRIREPLAAGDLPEAVKRLRLFVDHDPFALAPRHLLAALLGDAGHGAVALVQYEKLLTAAVTRGDLFRAIAAQRRIDEGSKRAHEPATYAALQRWFRLAGEANLLPPPAGLHAGLSPVRLLRFPPEVFAWVAIRSRLQRLDAGWHIEPLDGACQWNLLWGALRWEVGSRAARARQRHLVEGASLLAALEPGDRAPLRVAADVPSEALVFEPAMLRQLATLDPSVLGGDPTDDFVREDRARLIHRPGTPADLDARARVPSAPPVEAPPSLSVESTTSGAASDPSEWLEPGLLSAEETGDAAAATSPAVVEIPGLQRGTSTFARGGRGSDKDRAPRTPPRGRAGEIELPTDPVAPTPAEASGSATASPEEFRPVRFEDPGTMPAFEPAAAAAADAEAAVAEAAQTVPARRERRGGDRTPVAFRGRVRLLGLGHALGVEQDCRLVDLSPSGVRIELSAEAVLPLVRMLEGETLRIELEPSAERLQLAGRVCWLDLDGERPVQAGLEFVLLTRADRRALRRLIARGRRDAGPGAPHAPGSGPAADAA